MMSARVVRGEQQCCLKCDRAAGVPGGGGQRPVEGCDVFGQLRGVGVWAEVLDKPPGRGDTERQPYAQSAPTAAVSHCRYLIGRAKQIIIVQHGYLGISV